MNLLKPFVIFLVGYIVINNYQLYKERIKEIRIVGDDLYNLTEKNRDMMLLFFMSLISYLI